MEAFLYETKKLVNDTFQAYHYPPNFPFRYNKKNDMKEWSLWRNACWR